MERSPHMTSHQFRDAGKRLIDWLADYYEQVERYPVLAQVTPGEIRASLPSEPPASGTERHSPLSRNGF